MEVICLSNVRDFILQSSVYISIHIRYVMSSLVVIVFFIKLSQKVKDPPGLILQWTK